MLYLSVKCFFGNSHLDFPCAPRDNSKMNVMFSLFQHWLDPTKKIAKQLKGMINICVATSSTRGMYPTHVKHVKNGRHLWFLHTVLTRSTKPSSILICKINHTFVRSAWEQYASQQKCTGGTPSISTLHRTYKFRVKTQDSNNKCQHGLWVSVRIFVGKSSRVLHVSLIYFTRKSASG